MNLLIFLVAITLPGQRSDSSPAKPEWVLEATERRTSEIFGAWLLVRGGAPAEPRVAILQPSTDLWVGFASAVGCAGVDISTAPTRWAGRVASDTMLHVCARALRAGTYRLLASVSDSGRQIRTTIVRSDAIIATEDELISPKLWNFAGGLLAFLGGLVSAYLLKRLEERDKARGSKEEMQLAVIHALAPEIAANANALRTFLKDQAAPAPDMSTKGYNQLLSDRGVTSFLEADERKAYFTRVRAVYDEIQRYLSVQRKMDDGNSRVAAALLLKKLEELEASAA